MSIEIVILHGLVPSQPDRLRIYIYIRSRIKLTTTSGDGLIKHVTKKWLYSFCPNVKTKGWFKKGVPNPFHGCLWTIEYSKHTLSLPYTHKHTHMRNFLFTRWSNFSLRKYQSSMLAYLINQTNGGNKCIYVLIRPFNENNTQHM